MVGLASHRFMSPTTSVGTFKLGLAGLQVIPVMLTRHHVQPVNLDLIEQSEMMQHRLDTAAIGRNVCCEQFHVRLSTFLSPVLSSRFGRKPVLRDHGKIEPVSRATHLLNHLVDYNEVR